MTDGYGRRARGVTPTLIAAKRTADAEQPTSAAIVLADFPAAN